jgi:uncharacterized protein (DUF58 family)
MRFPFWPVLIGVLALAYALVRPGIWPWEVLVAGIALGLWLAYRRPPTVTLERVLSSTRTFAGAPCDVRVRLRVRARFPTLLTIVESPPRTLIPDRPAALTGLFWGSSEHELTYRVTPNSRGGFHWPGLQVNWSDPLGLFVQDTRIALPGHDGFELLVYPGTHPLELPDLARPLLTEGPPSRAWGLEDPSTFAGVRAYAPGDPQRRIHWRQTARFGMDGERYNQLVVRELERVAATGVLVHLDLGVSGRQAEIYLESAARLAASVLKTAFETNLRLGVSSLTGGSEYGGGFNALERSLAYLALVKLEPDAAQSVPIPPPGSNLVLITMRAPAALIEGAIRARSRAARVTVIAMPEGFYLEPGESPRPLFVSPPDAIRDLESRAGVLQDAGVHVIVLRGDESVLKMAYR